MPTHIQAIPNPFPFLKLPAEIRNMIYRLVLLTQNVTIDTPRADHTCRTLVEGSNDIISIQTGEAGTGTVRCEPWRTYTLGYQISILRTNKQIYHDACGIFQIENFWTIVCINKSEFGKEMRDRGFPVATGVDLCHRVRFPVMKVTVTFASLMGQNQHDALILATVHLKELMRALWTAKGASEMEVRIHVLPSLTTKSPSKRNLLEPFLMPRCVIKRVVYWSMSKQIYMNLLSQEYRIAEEIVVIFAELTTRIKLLQGYIKAKRWDKAISQADENAMLMNDCKIVYGNRLSGIELGIHINTAVFRRKTATQIMIAHTMSIAEITLYLHQHENAIRFANYALLNSTVSAFPNHDPTHLTVVPPHHQFLILLIRARAYMSMRQAEAAFRDIEEARELMPHSMALDSVSQTWQELFGPFPGSSLSPPTAP